MNHLRLLLVITLASHFSASEATAQRKYNSPTFLAECNAHGKAVVDICRDAEKIDRAAVHQHVAQLAFDSS